MIRPTLFYHLQDVETEQALVKLEGAQTYNKLRSSDDLSYTGYAVWRFKRAVYNNGNNSTIFYRNHMGT